MRMVIQRALAATASSGEQVIATMGPGLVAFTGFGRDDTEATVDRMAVKLANLRILEEGASKFGRSVLDAGQEVLLISQFTVMADTSRGRRPSFSGALAPSEAEVLYARLQSQLAGLGLRVQAGPFASRLVVDVRNWGPFTLVLEL